MWMRARAQAEAPPWSVRPMRDGTRRGVVILVVACLALAALSLLLPWALAFDPWVWVTWGRDVTRLELDTAGGGAWKPLPVVVTTPLALTGSAAPALWLVVAHAGGLLALAGAAHLADRLVAGRAGRTSAGVIAAVATAAAIAVSTWWLFNTALGNSEGLLVAAALWAVAAQLAGRWRAALALGVAAALLRPEVWPFLGLDALWLWRTRRASLGALSLALAPVPLLWFGPGLLGAGGVFDASDAARGTASPQSAVHADVPALEVLVDFAELVTLPVLLAAIAGAAFGGRAARVLGAGALAWVALVAVMTQAGYAGNPRYNVVPAALACVLAGMGVAALAARDSPGATPDAAPRPAASSSPRWSSQPSPSRRPTCPTRSTSSAPAPTAGRTWTRWSTRSAPTAWRAAARRSAPTNR